MRKIMALVMSTVILFTMSMGFEVLASESSSRNNVLSIYSQQCPAEVMDYARNTYERMVNSAVNDGTISSVEEASLGTPFTIEFMETEAPVYYFPVTSQSRVIATMRVYQDLVLSNAEGRESYTGILSGFLADELNELLERNDISSPVCFYVNGNSIMLYADGEVETFASLYGEVSPITSSRTPTVTGLEVINPLSKNATMRIAQSRPTTAVLPLNIIETQSSIESWCGAYCTSIILRYLRGNTSTPRAHNLMYYVYGADLEEGDAFGEQDTLNAGVRYGYSPILVRQPITATQVFAEIDALRPVYIKVRRYDATEGIYKYHAIVIRGYNRTYDTYSVWNPWYNEFETTMNLNTREYVSRAGIAYTWVSTIYDW